MIEYRNGLSYLILMLEISFLNVTGLVSQIFIFFTNSAMHIYTTVTLQRTISSYLFLELIHR